MAKLNIDIIHDLYEAISKANRHPILCTINTENILSGNLIAKNIYIGIYGDGMIKSGGFENYFFEIKFGKIKNSKVKKTFKELGFKSGLEILNEAQSTADADLEELDMNYYRLSPSFEDTLLDYVSTNWEDKEFVAYRKSISFVL